MTGLWLTLAALPAAGEGFPRDGTHWGKSSGVGKLGYLWRLSNLADLEVLLRRHLPEPGGTGLPAVRGPQDLKE